MSILRGILAIVLIVLGVSSFPYPREDRHKIGLALACISFVLSGLASLLLASWWPLPVGFFAGIFFALAISAPSRGPEAIAKVQALLAANVDPDAAGTDGVTMLHCAANNNELEVADLLIKGGADVNARDVGQGTALHRAAFAGNDAIIRLLVDNGADVNAQP